MSARMDRGDAWTTVEGRRFLATLLASGAEQIMRPVSTANSHFYQRMAKLYNGILCELQRADTARLSPPLEAVVQDMTLLPEQEAPPGTPARTRLGDRGYAGVIATVRQLAAASLPWTHLSPVDSSPAREWPPPKHIFIGVGPGLGIGTEMICFRQARRLAQAYRGARLIVSSLQETLWDRCDCVEIRHYEHDQLARFERACELLDRDPTALILFVDNAHSVYRQLGHVAACARYIYLDPRDLRIMVVDQRRGTIYERGARASGTVYETVDDLLTAAGIPDVQPARAPIQAPPGTSRRLFVNPFSSKHTALDPSWWSRAINTAISGQSVDVTLFAGVNAPTRGYASAIAAGLRTRAVRVHGQHRTPAIRETLDAALSSDVVFGLDTFTSHLANIRQIPGVTVFLGWRPDIWIVPQVPVLNVTIHDQPEYVGRLLRRMLVAETSPEYRGHAKTIARSTASLAPGVGRPSPDLATILAAYQGAKCAVAQLIREDPEFLDLCTDLPQDLATDFEETLLRAKAGEPNSSTSAMVQAAYRLWRDSNLCRYLQYIADGC